jgi:DNA-binding HxlR family transcriptional regulator
MDFVDYDSSTCSIARTAQILGDRWTTLVVRDLFNGVRRFDFLQQHLGIARDVLTKRLALLVEEGIVERRAYRPEGERTRHEYVLTPAGRELRTALVALMDWGDRHRAGASGPPVSLRHRDCGAEIHAHLACADGHDIETSTRAELVPLAGAQLTSAG